MEMKLFDCTLRDGANVVGNGFGAEITKMVLRGLTNAGVPIIEMGNAHGIGAWNNGFASPLNDDEYMDLLQPYRGKAEIGMFLDMANFNEERSFKPYVDLVAEKNLDFLRVGTNAGQGKRGHEAIRYIKSKGMKCYCSMMKGYLLPPEDLAAEAAEMEAQGADGVTIMDSAGTMMPDEAAAYTSSLCTRLHIPVGFHGHNNLGLSLANAMAAQKAGAELIDCGLLGMARSAGNLATEIAAAAFRRTGVDNTIDFYSLLDYLQDDLIPAMEKHNYRPAVQPVDLMFGMTGCHSSFGKKLQTVSETKKVNLWKLIDGVCRIDRCSPSVELMEKVADEILSGSN